MNLRKSLFISTVLFLTINPTIVFAAGNVTNQSFNNAKKMLMANVYSMPEFRSTVYCNAKFDDKKNITLPVGFDDRQFTKRSKRVEFEHIVPAENFGRTFAEWRDGSPQCVDNKGKAFKGRRCPEKVNTEYRYMQSDMYNLYPAIGSVNALRSNYNFTMLSGVESDFGACDMRIDSRKAQPPESARGVIARSYLYMDQAYKRYNMSSSQRKLMIAWDKMYPVTQLECQRSIIIKKIQKNENPVLAERCKK